MRRRVRCYSRDTKVYTGKGEQIARVTGLNVLHTDTRTMGAGIIRGSWHTAFEEWWCSLAYPEALHGYSKPLTGYIHSKCIHTLEWLMGQRAGYGNMKRLLVHSTIGSYWSCIWSQVKFNFFKFSLLCIDDLFQKFESQFDLLDSLD